MPDFEAKHKFYHIELTDGVILCQEYQRTDVPDKGPGREGWRIPQYQCEKVHLIQKGSLVAHRVERCTVAAAEVNCIRLEDNLPVTISVITST